jgi:Tryptophan-rich Synechocystis species C-terminal domain
LVQVGNYYFLYPAGGSSGPLLKYANGTPVVAGQTGNWVPIGAEQTASGYQVAWKLAGADQYTVWNTDASGVNVSSPIGIVSGSSAALEALELSFKQDLNGDDVIGTPTPPPGVTTVLTYDVLKGFHATGMQPASGNPFTYGTETSLNVGFTLFRYFSNTNSSVSGGPSITNDGTVNNYYFAQPLEFSGPTVAVVATGNILTFPSSVPERVPNDVLVMEPGSPGFNAPDLTVTRFTVPSAGTFDIAGSFTDLQQASVALLIVIDGKTVFSSSFSGQSPYQGTIPFSIAGISLQAGQTIDFVVDSLGNQAFDVVGLKALITETLTVTVIEAFGSTSLVQVGNNNFLYPAGGSSGPLLKYADGTTPVVAGQTGNWLPIGAEQTASGYEVAWKLAGADQYTVWNTDKDGTNLSSPIGIVPGSSMALQVLEPSFQQDLNGDGLIGRPTIGAGETLQVTSTYSGQVVFTATTGILELWKSSSFAGTVAGMTADDIIDFDMIDPTKVQVPIYSGDSSGGTLTVTDGSHTASIALLGNYLSSTFVASSDGHGGTKVVDPALPASSSVLAPSHLAA